MIQEMYWYVLVSILMEIQSPSYSVPRHLSSTTYWHNFTPRSQGENSGFEITGK